ncbi:hypothetical protein [Algoriphagus zhangzhouensis]|nr:hypothetical protein [Algoriphagus zhangzhouensis]
MKSFFIKTSNKFILFYLLIFIGCSSQKREMIHFEAELAEEIGAEIVEFSYSEKKSISNGRLIEGEKTLFLKITNSSFFKSLSPKSILAKEKIDELTDSLMAVEEIKEQFPNANQIILQAVEKTWIFPEKEMFTSVRKIDSEYR